MGMLNDCTPNGPFSIIFYNIIGANHVELSRKIDLTMILVFILSESKIFLLAVFYNGLKIL